MAYDPEDLTLGRGILSIAEWVNGVAGTYVDVGNCPRLDYIIDTQDLDHYSSRTAIKTKDKVVTLQAEYSINFDLDGISQANLSMFLYGTITDDVIAGLQGLTKRYSLKFVTDNATGPNRIWEFWKVKLSPGGTLSLIGDDWQILPFTR